MPRITKKQLERQKEMEEHIKRWNTLSKEELEEHIKSIDDVISSSITASNSTLKYLLMIMNLNERDERAIESSKNCIDRHNNRIKEAYEERLILINILLTK